MQILVKYSFFLLLSFILLIFVNTYTEASSSKDILHEVMQRSANITTLQTRFRQEKQVDFFDSPIQTTGFLYFAQNINETYSLLWEYNPPAASGIWFHNNRSWMWTQTRKNLQRPQGHESTFMNTMMQQMIFWLQINPQKITSLYDLELIRKHTIKLLPKYKGMFQSITVTFNDDLQSLQKLVLDEGKGNLTTLTFFETKYNIPAMLAFPDGTPLP